MQQILNDEVCLKSAPSVVIEDGVYSSSGSSDCTIKASYQGSKLVGLHSEFPGTSSEMNCAENICTGKFSGYSQTYQFKILSAKSFEYPYDGGRDVRVITKR